MEVRERFLETLLRVIKPQLLVYLERFQEVEELFELADVVSVGENQLHHVVRMVEMAGALPEGVFEVLGITRDDLVTAAIFHDLGKGKEIDDRFFDATLVTKTRVPHLVSAFPGMKWVEWKSPLHDHVSRSVEIAYSYGLPEEIVEAIAMHHHVKIRPEVLDLVGDALRLSRFVRTDIISYNPEQYTAPGNALAQVVAVLDQLCAIERKFRARISLTQEPYEIEDEVVRDLVIGVATTSDPRLQVLDVSLKGNEPVVLLNLRAFGTFVKLHTEYEIQNLKMSILQLIRSLLQAEHRGRQRELVALIEGDAYAVIAREDDENYLKQMIARIADAVRVRTGFEIRYGYGLGGTIPENFHQARLQAEINKKPRFLLERRR